MAFSELTVMKLQPFNGFTWNLLFQI